MTRLSMRYRDHHKAAGPRPSSPIGRARRRPRQVIVTGTTPRCIHYDRAPVGLCLRASKTLWRRIRQGICPRPLGG